MAPTHLLFDFFGTLVDYSPSRTDQGYEQTFARVSRAGARLDYARFLSLWNETFEEFEGVASQTHCEFSMTEIAQTFLDRALRGQASADFVREFVRSYVGEWNRGVRDLPGVTELLARLASRYRLAVITNTHEADLVPSHLERMGVASRFDAVVTSVECGARKPGRRIFEHALVRLDASPASCIHVGDSFDADYRGAEASGIRALLIDPLGKSPVPEEARLASILELERCLLDLD